MGLSRDRNIPPVVLRHRSESLSLAREAQTEMITRIKRGHVCAIIYLCWLCYSVVLFLLSRWRKYESWNRDSSKREGMWVGNKYDLLLLAPERGIYYTRIFRTHVILPLLHLDIPKTNDNTEMLKRWKCIISANIDPWRERRQRVQEKKKSFHPF